MPTALVFGDLADDFAGKPGEVLCGRALRAVIWRLRCSSFEALLAVPGGGQDSAGPGSPQVGKLTHGTGQDPQHRGVVLAERRPVPGGPVYGIDAGQGPGNRAGPRGELLERIEYRGVGPRHGSFSLGPQVPPQALPRVSGRRAGLLCRRGELAVVPRPGMQAGIRIGGPRC